MRTLKCIAVDDEPLALKLLEGYSSKTPFLEVAGSCSNVFDALEIMNRQKIDLLFLDVQMPGMNGVEFSRTLKNGPRIIFTTAFEQYAVEGFKVDALDYLLKPFDYAEFLRAANKAREWFRLIESPGEQPARDSIFVKSEYKLVQILFNELLYIEGLKDYVKIHITSKPQPVLSLISLKSLEEQLPAEQFMRIHRSYIINLKKIEAVERGQVIIGKARLQVADNYREKFGVYLGNRMKN